MDRSKEEMDKEGEDLGKEIEEVLEKVGMRNYLVFASKPPEGNRIEVYCRHSKDEEGLKQMVREVFIKFEKLRELFTIMLVADLKSRVLEDKLKGDDPGAKA